MQKTSQNITIHTIYTRRKKIQLFLLFLNANNAILKLQMLFFFKHNCHKTKEVLLTQGQPQPHSMAGAISLQL